MKLNAGNDVAVPEVRIKTEKFRVVPEMCGDAVKKLSIHAATRSAVELLELCPHCGLNVPRELMMIGEDGEVGSCPECYRKANQQKTRTAKKSKT